MSEDKYFTCGLCNGHGWVVWSQKHGHARIPLIEACKCNLDGEAMAPLRNFAIEGEDG